MMGTSVQSKEQQMYKEEFKNAFDAVVKHLNNFQDDSTTVTELTYLKLDGLEKQDLAQLKQIGRAEDDQDNDMGNTIFHASNFLKKKQM